MLPRLAEILSTTRVVAVPLNARFRGLWEREALLFEGPQGWTEFSPFADYYDMEASTWLAAAIDFGYNETPTLHRTHVPVNATVPAVPAGEVGLVLSQFNGCRTAKVKVAEAGQTLAEDVARVHAVRAALGAEGRVRIDANGGWNVDEAERAIHALADCDLEYVEQPCATVAELSELRTRIKYMDIPIAADESVRRAEDPLAVARAGAADILVIKAQPLGGIYRSLELVGQAGLPVVVSSALDTSVGISMGLHLAGALESLPFDCGLGTGALLSSDVTEDPLIPVNGMIEIRRPEISEKLLSANAADTDRANWWRNRLTRAYKVLAAAERA
jgi:O-succinylbenzoate synthase